MPNIKNVDPIKIGGYRYKVQPVKNLIGRKNLWGLADHLGKRFEIDDGITDSDFLATLVHECIEAIDTNRALKMEHSTISNLEDGLHSLLTDNADTFIKLLRKVKKS